MKKVILILFTCSLNSFAQSNFTQEWESPAGRNFHHIQNWESSNNIPEIVLKDAANVYVYDGNTKAIKYTYSNPDSSYFYTADEGIHSIPIDVNNDSIYEVFASRVTSNQYKLKVLNGANGNILYQNTWSYDGGTFYSLDVDGDGYTEILIQLINYAPGYMSKLVILSTTSHAIAVKQNSETVTGYKLNQNYPNPFNPNTIIEYSVSKDAVVRISVFDVLGQEVKVLVDEKQRSGIYKINFDGSGLSSGTYFYQITVAGVPEAKKMVLVR
jgi:hypothetical protein